MPASETHGAPTVGHKGVIYAVHEDPEIRAGQEGTYRTLTPAQQREEEAHVKEIRSSMLNKKVEFLLLLSRSPVAPPAPPFRTPPLSQPEGAASRP